MQFEGIMEELHNFALLGYRSWPVTDKTKKSANNSFIHSFVIQPISIDCHSQKVVEESILRFKTFLLNVCSISKFVITL